MANTWYALGTVAPQRALDALLALGPAAMKLDAGGVLVRAEPEGWSFVWRSSTGRHGAPVGGLYQELKNVHPAIGIEPFHGEIASQPIHRIGHAAALLLLNPTPTHRDLAYPAPKHSLVVAHRCPPRDAVRLFGALGQHATALTLHVRQDAGGRDVVLFHALDDASRRSSLESLRRSGRLSSVQTLRPFTRHGRTLFLPGGALPSASLLDTVLRLCAVAPGLFDLEPQSPTAPDHGLQFALFRVPAARPDGVEEAVLVPLVNAVFRKHPSLWPENGRVEVTVAPPPSDDDALERLARTLSKAAGRTGYRLELHRISSRQTSQGEMDALLKRLTELQQRYAMLSGERMARPRLLRFPHGQLERLATLLRRLPIPEGGANGVRYAMDAPVHAEPQHYLLIDSARTALPPSAGFWSDEESGVAEFVADPFWSHHYGSQSEGMHIFVPARHALFPVLHGWTRADAESHIRDIVQGWLTEQSGEAVVPSRPFYVFESARDTEDRIRLRVFDAQAFRPLDRSVLHWIADNIELGAAATAGIAERSSVLAAAADHAAALRLAQELSERSAAAQERLNGLAAAIHDEAVGQGDGLLSEVEGEVARIAKAAEKALGELDSFRKRLAVIEGVRDEAQALLDRLDRGHSAAVQAAERLTASDSDMGKRLDAQLKEMEAAALEIDSQVQAQLRRLATVIATLRGRIAESWSW
ncbi:hypothetical protein [Azospirillum sp. sgz302134]